MTKRTYENQEVRILWNSEFCIHTANCIRNGEGVFDSSRRPWVDLTLADTDTIVAAVEMCPTGALRYERTDGMPGETPQETTTIVPFPNGPLFVRGKVEVKDRHGDIFVASPRVALCRCGNSNNQPFCDLSHRDSDFRDHARASTPKRDGATSPDDISPEAL